MSYKAAIQHWRNMSSNGFIIEKICRAVQMQLAHLILEFTVSDIITGLERILSKEYPGAYLLKQLSEFREVFQPELFR